MVRFWQRVSYSVGVIVLVGLLVGCSSTGSGTTTEPTIAVIEPTTAPPPTEVVEPTPPPPTETAEPTPLTPTETPEPAPTETSEPEEPTAVPEPTETAEVEEVDIEAGVAVYQSNGCIGCHTLDVATAVGTVGPTHNGIGTTAEARIADPDYTGTATTAEEYIRESILNPTAFTVPSFPEGVMPAFTNMGEEQLDALVAMLLAQK